MAAITIVNFGLRFFTRLQRFLRAGAFHLLAAAVVASMYFHLVHLYRVQQIRSAAGRVQGALVQIESSERLYVITGDAEALRKYTFYRQILGQRLLVLCHLIPPTPRNEHLCRSTNALISAKLAEMQQTISLVKAGNSRAAVALIQTGIGVRYTDQIERQLDLIRIEDPSGGATTMACLVSY